MACRILHPCLGTCLFHAVKHVNGPSNFSFGHGKVMEKILKFTGYTNLVAVPNPVTIPISQLEIGCWTNLIYKIYFYPPSTTLKLYSIHKVFWYIEGSQGHETSVDIQNRIISNLPWCIYPQYFKCFSICITFLPFLFRRSGGFMTWLKSCNGKL